MSFQTFQANVFQPNCYQNGGVTPPIPTPDTGTAGGRRRYARHWTPERYIPPAAKKKLSALSRRKERAEDRIDMLRQQMHRQQIALSEKRALQDIDRIIKRIAAIQKQIDETYQKALELEEQEMVIIFMAIRH